MKNRGVRLIYCISCFLFFVGCEPVAEKLEDAKTTKRVEVFVVAAENFDETIMASAVASAHREYRISAEVRGRLKVKRAEWGDWVKKGDILFEIDSEEFTLIQQEKKAALARATARLKLMQAETKRKKPLLQSKTLSQSGWEELQFDLAAAVSEKKQAQVALDQARRNLRLTVIKSPIDGLILEDFHDRGEVIPLGTVLARVVDTTWMTFDVGVSDLELPHLHLGDVVPIIIDALGDLPLEGKITRISGSASPTQGTFPLEVRLENLNRGILPGVVARLQLSGEKHQSEIIIPMMAIHQTSDRAFVFLAKNQKAFQQSVKLGKVLGDRVLITEGLKSGDSVVVIAQGRLKRGESLEIIRANTVPDTVNR